MAAAGRRYDLGLRIDILEDRYAGLSDHAPFWAQGYDAILAIENYLPTDSTSAGVAGGDYRINTHYHTVVDLPDSINWELVTGATRPHRGHPGPVRRRGGACPTSPSSAAT